MILIPDRILFVELDEQEGSQAIRKLSPSIPHSCDIRFSYPETSITSQS